MKLEFIRKTVELFSRLKSAFDSFLLLLCVLSLILLNFFLHWFMTFSDNILVSTHLQLKKKVKVELSLHK